MLAFTERYEHRPVQIFTHQKLHQIHSKVLHAESFNLRAQTTTLSLILTV